MVNGSGDFKRKSYMNLRKRRREIVVMVLSEGTEKRVGLIILYN